MNEFDPLQFGAVPVKQDFDPSAFGAVPVGQAPSPKPKGDWLQRSGDFLKRNNVPGSVLGEAVGTSIHGFKSLLTGNIDEFNSAADENRKNMGRVLGDTVRSAAIPATFAIPGGGALASAGRFGAAGAVGGAGESMVQGNDFKQVAKDAFQSGLISGTTAGLITGVGNAVGPRLHSSATKVYNNALRVLDRIKASGKSPADFLVNEGVWGGLGSFKRAAMQGIKSEGAKIGAAAKNTPGGVVYDDVKGKALKFLDRTLGGLYSKPQLEQMIDDVPLDALKTSPNGMLDWSSADRIRSKLGGFIGDSKWTMANPGEKVKATQAVYNALSGLIKDATGTTREFARLSQWRNTDKVVDRAIRMADSRYGVGLYDVLSAMSGATYGGLSGEGAAERIKNAAIGGATAVALERAATTPSLKTGAVQLFRRSASLGQPLKSFTSIGTGRSSAKPRENPDD